MKRREFMGAIPLAAAAVPFAAGLVTPAAAQSAAGSTWDKVAQGKVLRIGAALLEPWYFKDTTGSDAPGGVVAGGTTWRGICPAFAAEVAKVLDARLEIVETTWGNAVAGLQAGQFDTMFMLDATPTRALSVDFVQTPMLWYPMSLIATDDINVTRWSDLNDPKFSIGVALGTNSDEYLTSIAPKANISRFQNSAEIFAAFQSGRTNAGVISAVSADLARARMGVGKTIVLQPAVSIPGGIAVRKEPDSRWREFLNVCAAYYYNTGKTQRLYEDFLRFRNIDPATAVPVQRELW
ncbi:polar amino acid transport system substrate-binding protein [Pseudochelatococcus lubricantis]|uniref:Polar amino acid transport system substrate-binding protein n=1 Tax=Pseudochelatococcus lubricantis TaxID=1538102 RepID=A0ABX0V0C3_9HYPH|nr:transporter substrate-binding domain-containing protein [Pseudochelatococcus lubricantis]NIJ57600.1 polar amino acid transport system substrate-binding protein [Pseudochelatococcus lubricantis]